MKDKGLEKAISGHYYWRMFCVILLFTTAAIFAQMIMGNRGIQMEIEYVVKQDTTDVEQILEKYKSMLEMSREYANGLSEQEKSRYFSVVCAENEKIDGVIYVTEENSVVYREDGSVVPLANLCAKQELILIDKNIGSRFGYNDVTKQNYLLLSVQEGNQKQGIGFFFHDLELLFENIGEYLCEGTLAFEVLCEKETAKHLTQLFGSASQEDFLERIAESQYKEIVHMSGMDKVLDKLQHQFYVYVSPYENWNFVHVYFFDVTQIGQLYLKNHSTLLMMMILVGFFLMTAGGYWHDKVYHKRRLARIKQHMSNSGIFRFMFDSKKIFLMSLDENFKIENVSEKLIDDLCDMPASEAIGNNLFFILKSNRLKEFVQVYQESGKETMNTVISFYERKYKKKAWYFVEIQNVPDELSGENSYLITFFEANSLLMAERVLDAIMQNTKDFMLILDEQYHVSFISEEAKRRMGIRKNAVGKLLRELPACQIDGRTLEEVLSGVTRYQPFDGTVHVDMQGEENWWATANAFVLTRENESYGILMVLKDITEYLEKNEEVARANKVKENLLFTVSHGIKTPLNALLGSADMLLTTMKKDAEENAYLKNMKQAVKELAGMLDEVLDFTKLDSDKMVLEEKEFDFAKMLENFASEAYISAQSRGLAFYMDISADVPESIYADEQWLKKALSNLVHIFTVMTAEGYVKLRIFCEERRFDEKYLHIELEGTGTRNERTKQSEFYHNGADKSANYNSENILCEFKYFMCRDIVRLMGSTLEDGKKGQNTSYTCFDLPLKTNAERNIVDCMELSGKSVGILMQNRDLEEHCVNVIKELQMVQTTADKADFLLTDGVGEYKEVQKRRGKRCLAIMGHSAARNKRYEGMLRQPFFIRSLAEAFRFEKKVDDSLEEEAKLLKGVKQIHALVVDDNSVNLMIATNMFKLLGATTETAEDGIQAIEKVKITKYDVILMDHLMPNMDGVCATKEIRNMENGSCLIFALTADLMEQVARMFEEAGADESLAKPLDLRTLKKKLLEWLPEEHLVFEGDEEAEVQAEEETKAKEWKLPELKAVKMRCPEIQIEVGLSYLQGNEEQYSKVLQATMQSLEDGLAKLPDVPNGSKEQRILVHGMKGMYFGIGADELAKKAADLEAAIKQENVAFVSANVASFIQASVELKDKLQSIFEAEEKDSDEKLTLSTEEYESICDKVVQALEMFDPDTAVKHLDTLIAASEGEQRDCMKQAKKKADNFDYEEALHLLKKGRGFI